MRIAEIYKSIQGEGLLAGTESVFVRTSGCNLRCRFCDTPYTSWQSRGDDLPVDAILAQVAEWDAAHVVVTGGEPMLYSELTPLTEALRAAGRHVTIETAGTLYLPVVGNLMSISPKLSNSTPHFEWAGAWRRRHERTRHRPEVVRQLISEYEYQFKFVIAAKEDCDEVAAYLGQIPEIDESRVMLMPEGTDIDVLARIGRWLKPYCQQIGWRFCPRLQIERFGLVRGT